MSVTIGSNKQSAKVYINNVLCRPRSVRITDMSMPYPFSNPCAVVYEDEIHVLGSHHIKWDGTEWVQVSTMSSTDGCAVVYDEEIHFFSATSHYGWDGTQWNTYSLPNVDMTDACCVVYDGDLHILGGSNNATMHYKWDGTEWQSVSTLPISFSVGGAVSYNNKLHIISDTNHYAWNGTEWVVASTMPTSFKYGDVLALDKLYVIGCGTYCSQTYLWDGTDWEEGIALSVPLVDGTAVEMNDSIYCIGGKGYFKMCVKYGDDIICGSIDIEGN